MPIDQMFSKLSCSLQIIGLNSDFLLFDSGFPEADRARPEGPRDLRVLILGVEFVTFQSVQISCCNSNLFIKVFL